MSDHRYDNECSLCHNRKEGKPEFVSFSMEEGDDLTLFYTICSLCRAKLIGRAATLSAIAPVGTVDEIQSAMFSMQSMLNGDVT